MIMIVSALHKLQDSFFLDAETARAYAGGRNARSITMEKCERGHKR